MYRKVRNCFYGASALLKQWRVLPGGEYCYQVIASRRWLSAIIILCLSILPVKAAEKYSNVKIYLPEDPEKRLALLSLLEVDHYQEVDGAFNYTVNQEEIQLLNALSCRFQVIDEDAEAALMKANEAYYASLKNPDPSARVAFERNNDYVSNIITTPSAFVVQPTLGGYYRFGQMDTAMNTLVANYPGLAQKFSIGTTTEGRQMWCIKISDNVATDESGEPELLYMGLHHAREAIGGASMIFLMQYLCENYSTNQHIKDLVDNREFFIIPCTNPDGWEYNRSTNPNGGGQWRKNRRNNGSGSYGVDLNRNWPVDWANCAGAIGSANCGSSTTTSDVYWGPSSVSEPETQNLYNFVRSRDFVVVMDQHSVGPYYSLPYGRLDTLLSAYEDDVYTQLCSAMGKYNGMRYGSTYQTLGYEVSGGMKDWLLRGDTMTIGKVFGMTGEGSNGSSSTNFWPLASQIIYLCKGMIYQDLQLAYSAGSYVDLQDIGPLNLTSTTGSFSFNVRRIGLGNDTVTVTAIPVENVASVGSPVVIPPSSLPNFNSTYSGNIAFTLSAGIQAQNSIKFVWRVQTGGYTYYDTVINIYQGVTLMSDNMEGAAASSNWTITGGGWAYTTEYKYNGSKSLAESPSANYANRTIRTAQRSTNLNLTGAGVAYLSFWVKHRCENFRDKLKVQVSTNGTTWQTLSGRNTVREPGNLDGSTINDTSSLTGIREYWTREVFSLNNFVGQSNLRLRLQFTSDASTSYVYGADEGFYIDDMLVLSGATPSVLPVELTQFIGENQGTVNILSWQTASEHNTQHYTIQRSADGITFDDIGQTAAVGNTTRVSAYTFTDNDPIAGDNFYRLMIVDYDGHTEYSQIVRIRIDDPVDEQASGIRSVYPNPTTGLTRVGFYEGGGNGEYQLRIYSIQGQVVHDERIATIPGEQDISFDTSPFAAGQYIIQLTDMRRGLSYEQPLIRQ